MLPVKWVIGESLLIVNYYLLNLCFFISCALSFYESHQLSLTGCYYILVGKCLALAGWSSKCEFCMSAILYFDVHVKASYF